MLFYYKRNNSKTGENSDKEKKTQVTYFFMSNPNLNVQNISIHGSKLMLCI